MQVLCRSSMLFDIIQYIRRLGLKYVLFFFLLRVNVRRHNREANNAQNSAVWFSAVRSACRENGVKMKEINK